jgi:uncharacterized membrane protein YhaH (DUF805 family)
VTFDLDGQASNDLDRFEKYLSKRQGINKMRILLQFDFFKYKGRVGRVRCFGLFSFWFLIFLIGVNLHMYQPHILVMNILTSIIVITALINIILLKIRRLHDFDMRGWYLFLILIPIVGFIWSIVIFCIPGVAGKNRFGDRKIPDFGKMYLIMTLILPVIFILLVLSKYLGVTAKIEKIKNQPITKYNISRYD